MLHIVTELVRLQIQCDEWAAKYRKRMKKDFKIDVDLERRELQEPISGNLSLIYLVMEIMGISKAEDIYWLEIYELMAVKHNDIAGLIDVMTGKRKFPNIVDQTKLEKLIYPKTNTSLN